MPYDQALVDKRDDSLTGPRSLTGPSAQRAFGSKLASAESYHPEVPRKVMKELMTRRDQPALLDTAIWLGLLALTGLGGVYSRGTWACVPFFFVFGVLYGSAWGRRWHEAGHGIAFKTAWMNDVVNEIASFMVMRNPVNGRWSHARHHSDIWHMYLTGMIQHAGVSGNIVDQLLNIRTCPATPVSRWICWNMNDYVEHHMFPVLPYHALPRLHALIMDDLPAPCPSMWAAYAEMIQAVLRERHEKGYCLRKILPATARPYRDEFHCNVPERGK